MSPPSPDVVLTLRHRDRLNRISFATAAGVVAAWDRLGTYEAADVEPFAEATGPNLTAARRAAIASTLAYLGFMLGGRAPTADLVALLAATVPDPRAPFAAYWHALSEGRPWEQAVDAGRGAADALGHNTVHRTARATTTQVDRTEERITGWRRVPGGAKVCDFCATASIQQYRTAETADFGHDRCGCAVVPVTADVDPGRVLNNR